jgi:hypothetical protein
VLVVLGGDAGGDFFADLDVAAEGSQVDLGRPDPNIS